MSTIEIIVARDGTSTLQTRGFTGSACREASRFLEQALGTPASERLLPEFYLAAATQQRHSESAG